jgi:hypothetical protein
LGQIVACLVAQADAGVIRSDLVSGDADVCRWLAQRIDPEASALPLAEQSGRACAVTGVGVE